MMLDAVKLVRDTILANHQPHEVTLEIVTECFQNLGIVDRIEFIAYDTPPENPIWGRFSRWKEQPAPYENFNTVVKVQYPLHLNEEWRRFVVCKELCHSLEAPDGAHSVSDRSIGDLVEAFSIKSASGDVRNHLTTLQPELLAEAAAVEILFPLCVRKPLVANGQQPDIGKAAGEYKIPEHYAEFALNPGYITLIEGLWS